MQKFVVGIICIVVGAMLLIWSHDLANSFGSQVQQIFTGAPTDRAVYLRIGGIVLVILGVAQLFWPSRRK